MCVAVRFRRHYGRSSPPSTSIIATDSFSSLKALPNVPFSKTANNFHAEVFVSSGFRVIGALPQMNELKKWQKKAATQGQNTVDVLHLGNEAQRLADEYCRKPWEKMFTD